MSDPNLRVDVPFEGRTVPAVLRLAEWGQIAGLVEEPLGARRDLLEAMLRSGIRNSVATLDGKPLLGDRMDALLADRNAVASIVKRRYEIYERVRSAGRLYARCPRCRVGEVELALLGLVLTVGTVAPEPFSADLLYFQPPITAFPCDPPRRPASVEYASQLRFELPTHVLGLARQGPGAGALQPIDPIQEADAWQRWETDGVNVPVGRAWWTRDSAAFRATVRLAVATRCLSPDAQATPELLERLPAVDVYFLDALYWYTHCVDAPNDAPLRMCPACGAGFLPVAPPA